MPRRFERYRVRDGVTRLGERFFNGVFADLDLRLADLEELRVRWEEVVATVVDFGLLRINEALMPTFESLDGMVSAGGTKVAEIETQRVAALAAIADLAAAIDAYEAAADTDIAGWKAATLTALDTWKDGLAQTYLAAVSQPSDAAYTYDGAGNVSTVTETVAGLPRVTTLTYNADGTVHTVAVAYNSHTRTETYAYDGAGNMTGMTAVEA